ncbi:MAG TPA: hypothetical protein VJU83_07325, partial [Burkholderiales bacterium]|nr:hypothetical protein [Burkholderiales bacterium]
MNQKEKFLQDNLKAGEEYAGLILGQEKGEPDYHLVLLPGEFKGTHAEAAKWAKKQGGELPNRREGALLYANAHDKFKTDDAYWTSETHEAYADFTWGQWFSNGFQDIWHKSDTTHA